MNNKLATLAWMGLFCAHLANAQPGSAAASGEDAARPYHYLRGHPAPRQLDRLQQDMAANQRFAQARREDNRKHWDYLNSLKIGLITQRLKLTSAQAEKFWPIYHRYEAERREIARAYALTDVRKPGPGNSRAAEAWLQENRESRRTALSALKARYEPEFSTVLSPAQRLELEAAERDFRTMLEDRLRQRAPKRGGRR